MAFQTKELDYIFNNLNKLVNYSIFYNNYGIKSWKKTKNHSNKKDYVTANTNPQSLSKIFNCNINV